MMVLAVDVAGDGSPAGDEFCARGDREKPAPGHKNVQDFRKQSPGLAVQNSLEVVKVQKVVVWPEIDQMGV